MQKETAEKGSLDQYNSGRSYKEKRNLEGERGKSGRNRQTTERGQGNKN